MRRLITLISAGRNRTIVIRRELPPTKSANLIRRSCRIERTRVLLSVSPSPVSGAAFVPSKSFTLSGGCLRPLTTLHLYPNRPHKSEKLSGDRRHDLRLILTRGSELFVTRVQSLLRLPADLFDVVGQALAGVSAGTRPPTVETDTTKPIRHYPSQMGSCRF